MDASSREVGRHHSQNETFITRYKVTAARFSRLFPLRFTVKNKPLFTGESRF